MKIINYFAKYRDVYLRCINSAIMQTHIFKELSKDNFPSQNDLLNHSFLYVAFSRWIAWHFQYFRCKKFAPNLPITLLKLKEMPWIEVRGIYDGYEIVNDNWHDDFSNEKEYKKNGEEDRSARSRRQEIWDQRGVNVMATCVTNRGLIHVSNKFKVSAIKLTNLIHGVIQGDINKSQEVLSEFLDQNRQFIGGGDDFDPLGPTPPPGLDEPIDNHIDLDDTNSEPLISLFSNLFPPTVVGRVFTVSDEQIERLSKLISSSYPLNRNLQVINKSIKKDGEITKG